MVGGNLHCLGGKNGRNAPWKKFNFLKFGELKERNSRFSEGKFFMSKK